LLGSVAEGVTKPAGLRLTIAARRGARIIAGAPLGALIAATTLVVMGGCTSLATPQVGGSASPANGGVAAAATPQVRNGAQLYVGFACVRCHAPDGAGGVPNRLNTSGDDDVPPLNNVYRDPAERFTTAPQVTDVVLAGSVISTKPGVVNMPSWKGVINAAQAGAIAAYFLAGFPHTGVQVDYDPLLAPDIYAEYACILCHGQVGQGASPSPALNPLSPDKTVPRLRNPADTATIRELAGVIMNGAVPPPARKGELLMPAWGQIMSIREVATILPYIQDGKGAKTQPAPPPFTPPPLAD
jgi:mono/diheme cytochrome c family protein